MIKNNTENHTPNNYTYALTLKRQDMENATTTIDKDDPLYPKYSTEYPYDALLYKKEYDDTYQFIFIKFKHKEEDRTLPVGTLCVYDKTLKKYLDDSFTIYDKHSILDIGIYIDGSNNRFKFHDILCMPRDFELAGTMRIPIQIPKLH